jgi:hypothetical protein
MAFSENIRRIIRNSPAAANERIADRTLYGLAYYRVHPEQIDQRLDELDREWNIERMLMANAAAVVLLGIGASVAVSRKFLAVPAAAGAFLLQHVVQGWCPPLPLLRWLGVRTQTEIEDERHALLFMRPAPHVHVSFSG